MAAEQGSRDITAQLQIKVVPGASRSEVSQWLGETLKIRVAAQPEKGRANAAVLTLLSVSLGLPKQNLAITSGATSPNKVIEIQGMDLDQVKETLAFFTR